MNFCCVLLPCSFLSYKVLLNPFFDEHFSDDRKKWFKVTIWKSCHWCSTTICWMGLVESSQTLIFHFISFSSILHSVEEGKGRAEFDWYFFDIDLIRRYYTIFPYDCEWYWTCKAPFILKIGIKLAFAWQSTELERNLSIINGFGILLKSGESAKNNFFLKTAKSNHFWFHSHLSSHHCIGWPPP